MFVKLYLADRKVALTRRLRGGLQCFRLHECFAWGGTLYEVTGIGFEGTGRALCVHAERTVWPLGL